MSKRTDSSGSGSLTSAALTAISTLVVSAFAAIVGVIIAREFGRTEETDGFFAAYGVFIVVALAAQAIRVAVLPSLARARAERRLAGTVAGFAVALAIVAVPLLLVTELATAPIARLLTGGGTEAAQEACAQALQWMVPAAVAHLFAGLAASGLAALDDYATAAVGYAAGSLTGLVVILSLVGNEGLAVVSKGMALNGLVALSIPLAGLAWRATHARMPATAVRPSGAPLLSRLGVFGAAAALPIALQLLYVVCLPFAARIGPGAVTSFGYAYIAAASLVSVTAFSIGLVSSVPLTRLGLDSRSVARHVASAGWVALSVIAGAVGVFALAGGPLVERILGSAYGGDVGAEVGRLVVVLTPWMVASVGVNVSFPLAFVTNRLGPLPAIGLAALGVQIALAWAGAAAFGLDGLALALALSTLAVLSALLRVLHALAGALRGLALAAAVTGGLALAAFVPPELVLPAAAAATVGLGLYAALVLLVRPAPLRASWAYLRALR